MLEYLTPITVSSSEVKLTNPFFSQNTIKNSGRRFEYQSDQTVTTKFPSIYSHFSLFLNVLKMGIANDPFSLS